jgi:hypothetical protein
VFGKNVDSAHDKEFGIRRIEFSVADEGLRKQSTKRAGQNQSEFVIPTGAMRSEHSGGICCSAAGRYMFVET